MVVRLKVYSLKSAFNSDFSIQSPSLYSSMVIALFLPFVGGPIFCSLLLRYNSLKYGKIFEYFIFEDNFTT